MSEKTDPDLRLSDKDNRSDILTGTPTTSQHILHCALLASICHGQDLLTADVGQAYLHASADRTAGEIYVPVPHAVAADVHRWMICDDPNEPFVWRLDQGTSGMQDAGLLWQPSSPRSANPSRMAPIPRPSVPNHPRKLIAHGLCGQYVG